MRPFLFLVLLASTPLSHADVYRWVDENGTVNYSTSVPPEKTNASTISFADAKGGFVSSSPLPCSTRCQGERMQPQFVQREIASAQEFAQRMELTPPPARGLDFRKFVSLREGMSEGELLTIAGAPDMQRRERSYDIYTYMPTSGDPFVTTITLLRGRVQDLDRVRKF